jgi:hypothetical protein
MKLKQSLKLQLLNKIIQEGPCMCQVYAVDRRCWRKPKPRSNKQKQFAVAKSDYEMSLLSGTDTDGKTQQESAIIEVQKYRSLYQKRGRKSRAALHHLLNLARIEEGWIFL